MKRREQDFKIQDLGKRKIPSPLMVGYFKTDDERIIYDIRLGREETRVKSKGVPITMEIAGPRGTIYFDPPKVKAAIASCGGLCPGVNDVIRAIVMELHFRYGIQNIIGIRYGFQGLTPGMVMR